MEIGVLKNGIKTKIDLTDAEQVFISDGTDIVPLMTPETIGLLRDHIRAFMEGACR